MKVTAAIKDALLGEVHRAIADAADAGVARVVHAAAGGTARPLALAYPPGDGQSDDHVFTPSEAAALVDIARSDAARSGLRKLLREAASAPVFHLFCLLDGVADPQAWDDVWLGAELAPPQEDDDREMLHDAFLESYHRFARPSSRRPAGSRRTRSRNAPRTSRRS